MASLLSTLTMPEYLKVMMMMTGINHHLPTPSLMMPLIQMTLALQECLTMLDPTTLIWTLKTMTPITQ